MYSNDPQVDQDAKSKFFVANMKYEFTEEEVTEWFSQFGVVENVRIVTDKDGKSRGFGFVEMATPEGTEAVTTFATAMNNSVTMMGWKNVNLKIHDEKRTKQNKINNNNSSYNLPGSLSGNNYYGSGGGSGSNNTIAAIPISNPTQYQPSQYENTNTNIPQPQQSNWQQQASSYYSNTTSATGITASQAIGMDQPPPYEASISNASAQPPPYSEGASNYYTDGPSTITTTASSTVPSNFHGNPSSMPITQQRHTVNVNSNPNPMMPHTTNQPPTMSQGMASSNASNAPTNNVANNVYASLPPQHHQPPQQGSTVNVYSGPPQSMYGATQQTQPPQYYMPQQAPLPQQQMNYNYPVVNPNSNNAMTPFHQQQPIQSQQSIPPPPPYNHQGNTIPMNTPVSEDIANKVFFEKLTTGYLCRRTS